MTALIEAASPHVMNTYGRVPIALERGQGCRVWDVNGKEYLDALAGIAVNTLGHNHPQLVPALCDQIGKLIHTSNYYHVPGQEQLAAKLVQLSGMSKVFFCNSGLEANEAALKIARNVQHMPVASQMRHRRLQSHQTLDSPRRAALGPRFQ